MDYVNSDGIVNLLGKEQHRNLVDFLNGNVFPSEQHFVHCNYIKVRCFMAWTNSPLEGCNNGIKYSSLSVRPNMGVAEATKTLLTQDFDRWKKKMTRVSNLLRRLGLRESSPTAKYLIPEAEGDLMHQFRLRTRYCSIRCCTSENRWKVLFLGKRDELPQPSRSKIPRFERLREVQVTADNFIVCSCEYYTQFGIPCRHIAHVLAEYYHFEHFGEMDVHLRYNLLYIYFVAFKPFSKLSEQELKIRDDLLNLWNATRNKPLQMRWEEKHPYIHCAAGLDVQIDASDHISRLNHVEDYIRSMEENLIHCLNYEREAIQKVSGHPSLGSTFAEVRSRSADDDSGFSLFDNVDGTPQKSDVILSNYDVLMPQFKELLKVMDPFTPVTNADKRQRVQCLLDETIQQFRATRRLDFAQQEPNGSVVSAKIPAKNAVPKHKKQRRF
jgi:hypothetical protein